MSETNGRQTGHNAPGATAPVGPPSPGALLRRLREQRGVDIGVLAATLKVQARKFELLEADRFQDLPDATFVKALALSVCRALKTDPAEVMAAYAAYDLAADPFKGAGKGLNEPMRHSGRGLVVSADAWFKRVPKGWWWVGALLLVLVIAWAWWRVGDDGQTPAAATAPADVASSLTLQASTAIRGGAVAGPSFAVEAAPSATPASPADTAAPKPPEPPSPALGSGDIRSPGAATSPAPVPLTRSDVELQISAQADSWLEVVDSDRRVVWSQVLPGGESVQLSAAPPLQVVVGNVGATRLTVDGQAVDLLPHARGNVARLQLP